MAVETRISVETRLKNPPRVFETDPNPLKLE